MTAADQLAAISDELEHCSKRVRAFQASLSNDLWQRKPAETSWSAIECIKHLALSSEKLVPKLVKAIPDAPVRASAKFHHDLIGWMLYRMMITRSKPMRVKTTPEFVPSSNLDVEKTIAEFFGHQAELMKLLTEAKRKDLSRVKIESPFREGLHYNVYSAFRVIAAHETRHLDQAERAARGLWVCANSACRKQSTV